MSDLPLPAEEFSVLHFSLIPSGDGNLAQRSESFGSYRDIEEAFAAARFLAIREWQDVRSLAPAQSDTTGAQVSWSVNDTEFGYDIKRDNLVVSRYWIHSKPVRE